MLGSGTGTRFTLGSLLLAVLLAVLYVPVLWREMRPSSYIKSQ